MTVTARRQSGRAAHYAATKADDARVEGAHALIAFCTLRFPRRTTLTACYPYTT